MCVTLEVLKHLLSLFNCESWLQSQVLGVINGIEGSRVDAISVFSAFSDEGYQGVLLLWF